MTLDLALVETYFLVQPLSWLALEQDGAVWLPLDGVPTTRDCDRPRAERHAHGLGLLLSWPARHPQPVRRAMRIAMLAATRGQGMALCSG